MTPSDWVLAVAFTAGCWALAACIGHHRRTQWAMWTVAIAAIAVGFCL